MAINLASKFSQKVDDRYKHKSFTDIAISHDYEWNGVDTVKVYSVELATIGQYNRGDPDRFGTATDLQDKVQSMKVAQEPSFTFIVDRGDNESQMFIKEANKMLKMHIDEGITPAIDKYRLAQWAAAGTTAGNVVTKAITDDNAYSEFVQARKTVFNNTKGNLQRMICFASADFIAHIEMDKHFKLDSDLAMKQNINGFAGRISNIRFIEVPSDYMPSNVDFLLIDKKASPSPVKLKDYRILKNAPGISGVKVEGRVIHDSFVLTNKLGGVFVHKSA